MTLVASVAHAQTRICDALPDEAKPRAKEILSRTHPYDCCDDTLAACLTHERVCRLVIRLANDVCRRVGEGQREKEISRAMSRRARSMMALGRPAPIDLDGVPMAGDASAPVVLVEVACARCPFCARATPQVYAAITTGPLAGKARLYFKLFPIRDHEHSKEAALAFLAAHALGKFWPYVLEAYKNFDDFTLERQATWASAVGLDAAAFSAKMADPALIERLVAEKKEGIVNKVEATPTFFIDGYRWRGGARYEELLDAVEEAYDRKTGTVY